MKNARFAVERPNETLQKSFPGLNLSLTSKLSFLSSHLPSLSNPSQVFSALQQKRRIFEEMNESSAAELHRSITESENLWETRKKETSFVRKLKKKRGRKTGLSMGSLEFVTLGEEPQGSNTVWEEIQGYVCPESREGATLTSVGDQLVLFGGRGNLTFSDTWIYTESTNEWTKLSFPMDSPEPRTGHTSVYINQQVLVIGGETAYNRYVRHHKFVPSVLSFDPQFSYWTELQTAGPALNLRRFHCSAVVGKHVFVQGGIGEKGKILEDAATLSLISLKWKRVETTGSGPGQRAFHTAVAVTRIEDKGSECGRVSGIYVFGGLDRDYTAQSTFHVLRLRPNQAVWKVLTASGQPPSPRYQHSMTYFPTLNCIAVFGGRQDARSESGYRCFNDLYLFHIEELTWTVVSPLGTVPEARCGHAAAALGTKLVVFGGIHNSHFCCCRLCVADLDPRDLIIEKERHIDVQNRGNEFKSKQIPKLSRSQNHSPTASSQKPGLPLFSLSVYHRF